MDLVRASIRRAVRQQLVELVEAGENPLSFLIGLVKDETVDLQTRLYAAEILLPYTAPRLNPLPAEPDAVVTAPKPGLPA